MKDVIIATKIWLQLLKNFDTIVLAVVGKGAWMSQEEKLISRLLTKPVDFTYNEAKKIIRHVGI